MGLHILLSFTMKNSYSHLQWYVVCDPISQFACCSTSVSSHKNNGLEQSKPVRGLQGIW